MVTKTESDKMAGLKKKLEELSALQKGIMDRFQAVTEFKPAHQNGKAARDQALVDLAKQKDEVGASMRKLEGELEIAEVEHLSGLTFSGEEKK